MKLQTKLGLFNGLSKLLLVVLGALLIPPVVQQVAVAHTDQRLHEKKSEVLSLITRDGLATFLREEHDETYADYNILKQEYITITPVNEAAIGQATTERIFEEPRQVGKEVEDFRILSYVGPLNNRQQTPDARRYRLEIGSSLGTVELLTNTLRSLALWVLVAGAALTVFVDAAFAHYLLRPLRELISRKLRGIRQPGEFSFARLDTDTADFRQLEKEREFMSNVSHELLTPTSILQSRFENMLQDPTLPEPHAQQIVESQRTLYRLRNTVRTLLLIANIENDQYLRDASVALRQTVADVAEELDDRRQQREIDLHIDLSPDYVVPQANATLLHTLLRNLLSNAIKYNHEGGQVRVLGRPRPGGGYSLRVEDDGPGIAPDDVPLLFDRFRRFHATGPKAPEGYGLGLPIAQTIAQFHKAVLRAESELGKGTAFIVDFAG
jgi:signal transduction histidine kinase